MKRNFSLKKLPLALLICGLVISAAAWQNQAPRVSPTYTDTVPKRDGKIRNFDEALEQLDKAKIELGRNMKDIDWSKMEKEIRESMQRIDIDMTKMKADLEKSLKDIDANKIKADVEKAMKEFDSEKMKAELQKALKEVDAQKIQAEVQASIAKIDIEKMKKELEEVNKIDLGKIKADMEKMKPELEKSLREAGESIEKAKEEIKEYKGFIDALHTDGLINKNNNYKVEHKNGELIINGKKQSTGAYNKYKSFLDKHKNITIEKEEGGLTINKD